MSRLPVLSGAQVVKALEKLHDELRVVHNTQQEHTARFDSIDSQLRSLTQLVGQVLERLPANPDEADE